MSTWNRIESGIKQGLKDVAASYGIDWSGAANTAIYMQRKSLTYH
ncbi:hypothetical protein [Geobacillus stearothermophilus]|nr:hypothetical protein [Geobacillus stearothermophilus]MED3665025.1 hypothetical protein [Geobacillus stearothermophilus]MED3732055.1 hypothetical protein [Geobacillus stearothermophilus]MED3734342.1 hypothetical protein [Geobacillus stearothermophilus]MED3740843.1 hypothetical protein [Geobacillus stearothermophilus]MED3766222.1 hypothetical protein [Geobacillus stearothermophilus]